MPRYVIRKIRMAHCKRGPERCAKCRELDVERYCLLDICPPHAGELQRRVIEVEIDGEPAWREYDVVQMFESLEEARTYAEQHAIVDARWE